MATMSRPLQRPLLPQSSISNYEFAPQDNSMGFSKKNYVFVDEHNRHKRLKVMRACEGCRRRKIKCDAATTNSWPCAACVRLKLRCNPPTVNYARSVSDTSTSGLERVLDFDSGTESGDESYMAHPPVHSMYTLGSAAEYAPGLYNRPSFQNMRHRSMTSMPMNGADAYGAPAYRPMPSSHPVQMPTRGNTWPGAGMTHQHLTEMMGELKIDETGVAPYIFQQKKKLAEAPALDEGEYGLPNSALLSGAIVRIPPELMPDDLTAQNYFEVFFREVHPYVPVISKQYFYSQWNNNRGSISPLLLEAIFACASRLSDEASEGQQWLHMASRHETCFMDVPRLSTVQALLILLKARESASKRGYFYRSLMTAKTLVEMGKDLELDQHYYEHQTGQPCSSDPTECAVKTRIWQAIFMAETMISGPQGRYDLRVDLSSVDFDIPQATPGITSEEYQVSYNFTYMVRTVRNVRWVIDAYAPIRKSKNWASDARLAALSPQVLSWIDELPQSLQIHYPTDGSAPWIPDHFVANMHCYYELGVLMLNRPQLMAASSFSAPGDWQNLMTTCYSATKNICKLQEAISRDFGMTGLSCMIRGYNFAIYCTLTCVMVHLVALNSQEPEINNDAREYFTRHMRVLEDCAVMSPMKELQGQVQTLREAFSADVTRPFELKTGALNGSIMTAVMQQSSVPDSHRAFSHPQLRLQISQAQQQQILVTHSMPVTPISDHGDDNADGPLAAASLAMMSHQKTLPPGHHRGDDGSGIAAWNPAPIFEYATSSVPLSSVPAPIAPHQRSHSFSAADLSSDSPHAQLGRNLTDARRSQWPAPFGTPASSVVSNANQFTSIGGAVTSVPNVGGSPMGMEPGSAVDRHSPTMYSATGSDHTSHHLATPVMQHTSHHAGAFSTAPSQNYVSPTMWQDGVANTYASNTGLLKRRWTEDEAIVWAGSHSGQP